jgi:dinuclear metal center YbgI/SA1388 family protein
LVHHGYFWKNEAPQVTGVKRKRLALLLRHDLNLFAYHLPLDAHPQLGNNAQLAARLGFTLQGWFGEQNIAAHGTVPSLTVGELARRVHDVLGRAPLVIGDPQQPVRTIAWCSGGAQDYLPQAVAMGVDAYLSGEISEHTVHLARESGVAYLGAGHHATERYGIQALGEHLAGRFGLEHRFIDLDNPV